MPAARSAATVLSRRAGVGDQHVDLIRSADHGQRCAPDLRGVADDDHAPRPLDHLPVGLGLDLVVGRHALRRGAVDPDEQEIQVEPGKGRVGEWADQLVGLRAGRSRR